MDNLEETDRFLETYNLPGPNQKETNNSKRFIISSETEFVIKILPAEKVQHQMLHKGILPNILRRANTSQAISKN